MGIRYMQKGGSSDGTVAVGAAAEASGLYSVALGEEAEAGALQSVALGAGSVADRDHCVSVGRSGVERQIAHVAAGSRNTDAVNLSQLSFIASVLGETRCLDGAFYLQPYRVQGIDYRDVGAAIAAINRHLGMIYGHLADAAIHGMPTASFAAAGEVSASGGDLPAASG